MQLEDESFPLAVTVQAFNPLVFGDTRTSSLPLAVLRYRLHNRSDQAVRATTALSMSNFIGSNGTEDATGTNQNRYRQSDGLPGITMTAPGLPSDAEAAGEVTIAMITPPGAVASHRTQWADQTWGGPLLEFWDDLTDDGVLDERQSATDRPVASLAATVELPAGSSGDISYLITWNFPNRRAWIDSGSHIGDFGPAVIGNAYSVAYPDSWTTACSVADQLPDLEGVTVQAVAAVVQADAPVELTEAALFNLSTLRSATVFQSAAGDYYGWEGVGDHEDSCHGTCTHVWGYEFVGGDLRLEVLDVAGRSHRPDTAVLPAGTTWQVH